MPSALDDLISGKSGQKAPTSLADFQSRVAELERLQRASGARKIEQDSPGAMRTIIDILSRPNYAVAGFTEELLTEKSISGGVARALSEIFSGVAGVQGEKRAFGEVLERLGVGTVTLADAFPALEGTWVGAMGSRGAAGIALDILADPLTYVTFGTAAAAKLSFKGIGRVALNQKGIDLLGSIQKEVRPLFEASLKTVKTDPQQILRLEEKYEIATKAEFLKKAATNGKIRDEFLDPGGIKFLGESVVKGSILKKMGTQVEETARTVLKDDIVDTVINGTRGYAESFTQHIRNIFHPFNELARLPPELRERAIELRRRFVSSHGAVKTRMHKIVDDGLTLADDTQVIKPGLGSRYRELEKQDRHIGKKFYDLREQTRKVKLTPAQQEVFDEFVALQDFMTESLVGLDILKEEMVRGGYFFGTYKNADDLKSYHWNIAKANKNPKVSSKFEKMRYFESKREAVRTSRQIERSTKLAREAEKQLAKKEGRRPKAVRVYPALEPDYDLLNNMRLFIDEYSDAIARSAWREDLLEAFGIDVASPAWRSEMVFEVSTPVLRSTDPGYADDARKIEKIIGEHGDSLRDIDARLYEEAIGEPRGMSIKEKKSLDMVLRRSRTLLGWRQKGAPPLAKNASLSSEKAKKELVRQLTLSAKSAQQYAHMANDLVKHGLRKYLPDVRGAIKQGEVEKSMLPLADKGAEYGFYRGGWWGDVGVAIPQAIARDIEEVSAKALGVGRREWSSLIRGVDFLNNTFKLGVYTFWPASAIRDAYSNVALSMLDIGVGALDPKMHREAMRIVGATGLPRKQRAAIMRAMKDEKFVTKQGTEYSLELLIQRAQDLGVIVPGEVFAELTGDPAKFGAIERKLRTAAHYRGLIENEARVQLWMNWIRRGLTPAEAADRVSKFLFNYGELSAIERELFRRVIPFYTFTRKNVVLQSKALVSKPGLVVGQTKPLRGRESENEWMVKWEAEGLKLRLDGDGKSVHVINGVDLPLRNLDTLWAGGVGETGRRWLGMITPFIKTPIETIAGVDFFTGGELKRQYGPTLGRMVEHAPAGVKDWLGYKKTYDEAGRPIYTFDGTRYAMLVKSWAFSRFFSTTDRQFRDYLGDREVAASMLDILSGLRAKELNFSEQQRRVMFRRIKQLEDSLVRRGVLSNTRIAFQPANEKGQIR